MAIGELDRAKASVRPIALDPLFRWPGGKRWLVDRLLAILPERTGRYIEPFFGAGALFFALRPEDGLISDANAALMACYRAIQREPLRVGAYLQSWETTAEDFYRIRGAQPSNEAEKAARFVFLTAHAFNGIYRVNRKGEFNVPWGGRPYPDLGNAETLSKYSEALDGIEIRSGDFETALAGAQPGDLVYLDPPYTVAHSNNGFLKYNDHIFSWRDQERLASRAVDLASAGCHVVISNAHHPSIRSLYGSFEAFEVPRHSVMAAARERRGKIREYVFTNIPGVDLG